MFGGSRAKLFSRPEKSPAGLENFSSHLRTFSAGWRSFAGGLKSFSAG
jgi:hypothetical protein